MTLRAYINWLNARMKQAINSIINQASQAERRRSLTLYNCLGNVFDIGSFNSAETASIKSF